MNGMIARPRLAAMAGLAAMIAGTALAGAAPAQAAPAQTWTSVQHDVVLPTEFFPDDICGPRASYEDWTNTTQVEHLTVRPDGSFMFMDFETGYIDVDYVDPAIPDTRFKRTETFTINLTPGDTFVETSTMRQSDGELTIRVQYHLTLVNGVPVVSREVTIVSGCPA
jgi:hypothetical protein